MDWLSLAPIPPKDAIASKSSCNWLNWRLRCWREHFLTFFLEPLMFDYEMNSFHIPEFRTTVDTWFDSENKLCKKIDWNDQKTFPPFLEKNETLQNFYKEMCESKSLTCNKIQERRPKIGKPLMIKNIEIPSAHVYICFFDLIANVCIISGYLFT